MFNQILAHIEQYLKYTSTESTNTATYDLGQNKTWETSNIRTVLYGTKPVYYGGPETWEIISFGMKFDIMFKKISVKVLTC